MGDIKLTNQISVNHKDSISITVTNNISVTGHLACEETVSSTGPGQTGIIRPGCGHSGISGAQGGGTMADVVIKASPQNPDCGSEAEYRASPQHPEVGSEVKDPQQEPIIDASPQVPDGGPEAEVQAPLDGGVGAGVQLYAPEGSTHEEDGVKVDPESGADCLLHAPEVDAPHDEDEGGVGDGHHAGGQLCSPAAGALEDDGEGPGEGPGEVSVVERRPSQLVAHAQAVARPITGPGAEVKRTERLDDWTEACQNKKCQRCLKKENQESQKF